jgi:N-acetylmuramic acid 6-phosphate (MurNAc-6-P) etherase
MPAHIHACRSDCPFETPPQVLISCALPTAVQVDAFVPLGTGAELVTGSTRMKAGTATKKILNTLTTTALILCGKVRGTCMIDLACVNSKLIQRACSILCQLCPARVRSDAHALALLQQCGMNLRAALAVCDRDRDDEHAYEQA